MKKPKSKDPLPLKNDKIIEALIKLARENNVSTLDNLRRYNKEKSAILCKPVFIQQSDGMIIEFTFTEVTVHEPHPLISGLTSIINNFTSSNSIDRLFGIYKRE